MCVCVVEEKAKAGSGAGMAQRGGSRNRGTNVTTHGQVTGIKPRVVGQAEVWWESS